VIFFSKDEEENLTVHYIMSPMVPGIKAKERLPLKPIEVIEQYSFQNLNIESQTLHCKLLPGKIDYIIIVVCNATRWVEALAVKNCTAETVADEMLKLLCQKCCPTTIRSDNFRSFKSEVLTAVRQRLRIGVRFAAHIIPNYIARLKEPTVR